jgi:RNA polymerase sigma-70 factor, ECF subfamily
METPARSPATPETLLARYAAKRSPKDLAALFDLAAPELFRLALHLCPDAATAEDVLQDTFLAVLERVEQWDAGRAAMPWLVGILRNEALMARRRAARRPDPGRLESAPPDDPAATASSAEQRERVREAMRRLPEPYREAAILRWRYGLEPAAIAEVKDVPPATVRSWLHRALKTLRGELAALPALLLPHRAERGLDAVRAAVVQRAAAQTVGSAAAAALATGGLLMAKKTIVAVVLVLLVAVGGWVAARPADVTPKSAEPSAAPVDLPASRTTPAARTRSDAAVETSPGTPTSTRSAPEPEKPKDVHTRVTGRVVDVKGTPVAGARVAVRSQSLRAELSPTLTGENGSFDLDVASSPRDPEWLEWPRAGVRSVAFVAAARSCATTIRAVELVSGGSLELGDVVLAPGGTIRGRVLDAAGSPVAGAWVGLEDTRTASVPEFERRLWERDRAVSGVPTLSDEKGAFVLEGAAVGTARVFAGKDGFRSARSAVADVVAGGSVDVEVRLEPQRAEDWVEGRVLGPDGEVVRGAHFTFYCQAQSPDRCSTQQIREGADGAFSIPVDYVATYHVLVDDPSRKWGPAFVESLRPGDRDVAIRFPAPRTVPVKVSSRDGEPVLDWEAQLSPAAVRFGYTIYGIEPGPHPGGSADLRVPGFAFRLDVRANGFLRGSFGPFDPTALPHAIECVLTRAGRVRGRVATDVGPAAGAHVLAYMVTPADQRCTHDGLPLAHFPDPEAEMRTDETGAFSLPLVRKEKYVVRVELDGFAPSETQPLAFDPAADIEGVEVRLGHGGAIEGRVLTPTGRSPEGTIAMAHRGDARPRSVRVGSDGRFRFEGLIPGPWIVARGEHDVPAAAPSTSYGPGRSEFRWTCTVEEGRTTTRDIDLTGAADASLRGRFATTEAAGTQGWTVALVADTFGLATPAAGPVTLGADGAFQLVAPSAGRWRLLLVSPDSALRIYDSVTLPVGETPWKLDLSFGRVEGTAEPSRAVGCIWESSDGRWALAETTSDREGRFAISRIPSGRVRILGPEAPTSAEPDPRRWKARREVDVRAGDVVRIE